MFKLESNRLKREFKISNNSLYASQILNKYSSMSFVPDGNGSEFVVHFTDGSDFSAKGLSVVSSSCENDKLKFVFEKKYGLTVTLEYWIHEDKNTICKQLTLDEDNDERVIDFVNLENVGIINSRSHLSAEIVEGSEIPETWAALGQPFYIDSLFFGCEFPATDNRIVYGLGRVKYFIGRNVGKNYKCPVTVMGAAKDDSVQAVKKAFFEYLDTVTQKITPMFNYNNWYETMGKANEESVLKDFKNINEGVKSHSLNQFDCYVVDDVWNDYKAKFWKFKKKTFPNGLDNIEKLCEENGTKAGLWLGPRGAYTIPKKFGKKIQRAGNGYVNMASNDICVASKKYLENLGNFLSENTEKYKLGYLKLDGFCLRPCKDSTHDHMTGGKDDMYFVTDMVSSWIKMFEKIRSGEYGKDIWINLTCYVNPSPWYLQWVNSIWLQNSADISFTQTADDESKVDEAITYRDGRYYDTLCRRNIQLPAKAIYNHEPIYGKGANIEYTDDEFEKYLYWNAIRGCALNDIHLSSSMMNDNKWNSLKKVIAFQKENFDTLKDVMFLGGDPTENNVYGYVGWGEKEGIIALRNPDGDSAPLTLTFNKLMGAPEGFKDAKIEKNYGDKDFDPDKSYAYGDKLDLELKGMELVIFKLKSE